MVLNAAFKIFQLYRGGQFYQWRKQEENMNTGRKHEYREKTTDLPQITDKLYHIINYNVA